MRRKTTTWPAASGRDAADLVCGGISGSAFAAVPLLAGYLIYMAAAGPASAMQILDAVDHAELEAEVSATGVSLIALSHDRIRRVIRSADGFEIEHDPETGDLWLRPAAVRGARLETSHTAPATVFLGTEKGFTYRLTLTPAVRDSAQILIRNGAAQVEAAAKASGADPRVATLVGLVRAVARREPPAGYAIETGNAIGGLPAVETWRGPRFAAHVVESRAAGDAADLAMGVRAAAVWLGSPGSGPSGGRLAVIVTDSAQPDDALAGGPV